MVLKALKVRSEVFEAIKCHKPVGQTHSYFLNELLQNKLVNDKRLSEATK